MITTNRKKITKKRKIAGVFEIRLYDMLYHLPDKFVLFCFIFTTMEDEVYDTSGNFKHLILDYPFSKRGN